MKNDNFDKILIKTAVPPPNIIKTVSPWKKSINRILIGLVLTSFTLNVFYLDYILPAIGVVYLLLGYRSLKYDNKWFKLSYYVTIVKGLYVFGYIIVNSNIYRYDYLNSDISIIFSIINLLLQLVLYIFLFTAFSQIEKKSGIISKNTSVFGFVVWYVIICLLAIIKFIGTITIIVLICLYILIIKNLYKLSCSLNESGYSITTHPICFSDKKIVSCVAVLLVLGLFCSYTFGSRYSMNWSINNQIENDATESIKKHLNNLGVPNNVLDDLCIDEILLCKNAWDVVVQKTGFSENKRMLSKTDESDLKEADLLITNIGILLDNEKETWMVIHHFYWQKNPSFYGTESIMISPTYNSSPNVWEQVGSINGRLLYDLNGKTYTSDYFDLYEKTNSVQNSDIITNMNNTSYTYATFSLSYKGENNRGYLIYLTEGNTQTNLLTSWVHYTHQTTVFQYPVITADEHHIAKGNNKTISFETFSDALQFNRFKQK